MQGAALRAMTASGYPAPGVLVEQESPEGLGGPYLVMERVPGRSLMRQVLELESLVRRPEALLRALPSLLREEQREVLAELIELGP